MGKVFIDKLFRAKLSWFDSKTVGQILERAISYQDTAENSVIHSINHIINTCFDLAIKVSVICLISPKVSLVLVPSFLLLYWYSQIFDSFEKKMMKVCTKNG